MGLPSVGKSISLVRRSRFVCVCVCVCPHKGVSVCDVFTRLHTAKLKLTFEVKIKEAKKLFPNSLAEHVSSRVVIFFHVGLVLSFSHMTKAHTYRILAKHNKKRLVDVLGLIKYLFIIDCQSINSGIFYAFASILHLKTSSQ